MSNLKDSGRGEEIVVNELYLAMVFHVCVVTRLAQAVSDRLTHAEGYGTYYHIRVHVVAE